MLHPYSDKVRIPVCRVHHFSKSITFLSHPHTFTRQEQHAISASRAVTAGSLALLLLLVLKPACTQLTAPLKLSICEELWCCVLSPWKIRLVTSSNLYLCMTSELPGEHGNPFIPALMPSLGKVSIKSAMRSFSCSSGTLHRRRRITRFTQCFITADTVFLQNLLHFSPVRKKEQKPLYASAGRVTDPLTLFSLNSLVTLIPYRSLSPLCLLFPGLSA